MVHGGPALCPFPAAITPLQAQISLPRRRPNPPPTPAAQKAVMDPTSLAALIGGIIIVAIIGTVAVQTSRDTNHDDRPLFARKQP